MGHWVCGNWVRFAFLVFHGSGAVEIGFVSQKYGVAGDLVCENWVRFAFLGLAGHLVCVNWVRFAFFGVMVYVNRQGLNPLRVQGAK